ncbi:MAG: carboxyl transferase domain-containing protein [Candidatus Nanopelagicales bacterium]
MASIPTAELLSELLDDDSWRSWDAPVADPEDLPPDYLEDLSRARAQTRSDESVVTGSARLDDQPVAVIAGDFDFLAGSVGVAAAARLVAAVERATALGLPLLGLPVSGGTRMHEGTPAFVQMAVIAGAVRRHTDAGLPYLVYLRHPTTGGVFATWGSLGDVTFAEPGALTGFLGPRVYEGLYGRQFPDGAQTAEGLVAAGVIDGVATPAKWRGLVSDILAVWRSHPAAGTAPAGWESPGPAVSHPSAAPAPERDEAEGPDAWARIQRTRTAGRPGARELLATCSSVVELSGTQAGETAAATILALAQVDDVGCVVVAQDRRTQAALAADDPATGLGPADLRVARRGMSLAARWGLPLVTVVDTQGAELSAAAEHGALAGEIARCLADLAGLPTPTLSVLLGGGAGGAALALLPADRVVAAPDAWVTPLPAEGASLIRYRTVDRAAEVVGGQRIIGPELAAIGAVDRIVAAPVTDRDAWHLVLAEELSRLVVDPPDPAARRWPRVP